MASRDLTANFIERRNAALKRRGPGGVKALVTSPRLTAGGTDEGYSLSLMEVRYRWVLFFSRSLSFPEYSCGSGVEGCGSLVLSSLLTVQVYSWF